MRLDAHGPFCHGARMGQDLAGLPGSTLPRVVPAAKAVRAASPEHLAEAEEAAAAVERKLATFDEKLAKEAAYSQAVKKFGALDPDVAAKLLKLE